MGRSHSDDFVFYWAMNSLLRAGSFIKGFGRVLDFGPGRLLLLAQRQVTLMFSFADVKGEYREKRERGTGNTGKLEISNCKFKI